MFPWQIVTKAGGIDLTAKLSISLSQEKLLSDLSAVTSEFRPSLHFRNRHYVGEWGTIGLIAANGRVGESRYKRGAAYLKTEAIKSCTYIEAFLDSLRCKKWRVRLLVLSPGSQIRWHYDNIDTIDRESVRLHAPIVTNDGVQFEICHVNCPWKPGELWYGDFSFPHRVFNKGAEQRWHLVMDLVINDWISNLFPDWINTSGHKD
jgi:hypothetical protein